MASFRTLFDDNNHKYSWDGHRGRASCPIWDHKGEDCFLFTSDHGFCLSCGFKANRQQFIDKKIHKQMRLIAVIDEGKWQESKQVISQIIEEEFDQELLENEQWNQKAKERLEQLGEKEKWTKEVFTFREDYLQRNYCADISDIIEKRDELLSGSWLKP